MNPYDPPTEAVERPLDDNMPLVVGLPIAFASFTAFMFLLVWVFDHFYRWLYELPFRWWM